MSENLSTIELEYERSTKGYFLYKSNKHGFIISVYVPRGSHNLKPVSVKVVIEDE